MLSFTEIINYLVKNKTKIVDDIYRFIQIDQIDSEYISLSINFSINNEIYYRIHRESDGAPSGLFLNLIDIWISDEPDKLTKNDIEEHLDGVIFRLRRLITTNRYSKVLKSNNSFWDQF